MNTIHNRSGQAGVVAGQSAISSVESSGSNLRYRGDDINVLADYTGPAPLRSR